MVASIGLQRVCPVRYIPTTVSTESEHASTWEVFARRVKAVREGRGWTQKQLAARLTEIGFPTDRVTIHKIESGGTRARNVPLREALAIAAALELAPVHLFAPLEDEAMVAVTETDVVPAAHLRDWIRGGSVLPGHNKRRYLAEMPESELRQMSLSKIVAAATPAAAFKRVQKAAVVAGLEATGLSLTEIVDEFVATARKPNEEESNG